MLLRESDDLILHFGEVYNYFIVYHNVIIIEVNLVAQLVKNLAAMWETQVQSLDWEDLLKKGMKTHSSILAWTQEPGGLQSMGSLKVGHD